ncbi:adipocyte plasma membrane-associated protein-like [Babylonia areolata]|uniref:adipocyte plasma membrane-associated protein-like n=1 Tax=Babylonia areolata TaxID=304850 RepID=UPI003FD5C906
MKRMKDTIKFPVAKLVVAMVTVALNMNHVQMLDTQPHVVKLPTPPALVGVLSANHWLAKARRYAENKIVGPGSMVVVNRYVYTGLKNGWVVEVRPDGRVRGILRMSNKRCGTVSMDELACGRPLGVRADRYQYLVVADAYKGIFRINPRSGAFRTLVDASMLVNNKPLGYINDLAVSRDGTIFFTSSSAKYNRTSSLDILLEGESTGRVLVYNPREAPPKHVRELVSNLRYASGLQLARDESYLLIGEGGRAKIHRAWIGLNTPKRGTIETFAENLPGFVGNIRLSPRNTFWVALSGSRSKDAPSLLDLYGAQPERRRQLMAMKPSSVQAQMPKHGLVVELDQSGKIVRSLHDPHGLQYSAVSEVEEENGILYLGSLDRKFVGVLPLRRLPPPVMSSSPGEGSTSDSGGGEGGAAGGTSPSNDKLETFLEQVRKNTRSLSGQALQDIVILLVRRLVEAVSEIRRVLAQANELRKDLNSLQNMFPNDTDSSTSPSSSYGGPTTQYYQDTTWFDFSGGGGGTTMSAQTADPTSTVGFGAETTTEGFTTSTDAQTSTATSEATTATTETTTTEAPTTTTEGSALLHS